MTEASLRRKRALARAALWWEAAWPAAWPALGVAGLFVVFALLGIPALLPAWLHLLILLGLLGGLGWAVWRGWQSFRRPDAAAIDRRLERATGLPHRPLAALQDQPATSDPAGLALWGAHQSRMRGMIRRLRVGPPRPGLAARDRRALRGGCWWRWPRLSSWPGPTRRLCSPAASCRASPPPSRPRRCATRPGSRPPATPARRPSSCPPAAARPPCRPEAASRSPSRVAARRPFRRSRARLASPSRPWVAAATRRRPPSPPGHASPSSARGASWSPGTLPSQADAPPVATFTEAPARAQRGLAMRLPWRTEDDWGVVALAAEFRLAARPEAAPILLDMTLPSSAPRQARGLAQPDLSAHPWAGLEVVLRLVARDGAGRRAIPRKCG